MLLMSLRCYINCMVPTTEKDVLLKSQYYILDVSKGSSYDTSDSISWTEYGDIVKNAPPQNNNYRITYVNVMNPAPHTGNEQYIRTPGGPSLINKQAGYLKHLMNSDTMIKVYNELFNTNETIDYPVILLMFSEHYIIEYGHIIANYLSNVFGEDVTFLDPTLRPNVPGNRNGFYPGNKATGSKNRLMCRNKKLMKDMSLMLDSTSRESTETNIINQLACYTVPDMINLYNTIYPDKPLHAGYYTKQDMIDIIIGSITRDMHFSTSTDEEYRNEVAEYEQQLTDWEQLQEDFRTEMLNEAVNFAGL